MKFDVTEPLGVRITDVKVGALDNSRRDIVRGALAEHGVVVLPEQNVNDDDFLEFLKSFGHMVFTEGETPLDGYPDLNVISNVGRSTPPKSTFHVDTTYVPHPPDYTALRAVDVPIRGGQTLFSNQYRAYESLPDEDRAFADRCTVTHRVTGLPGIEGSAAHPLALEHPTSRRTALYLSAPSRCVAVSGMSEAEGAEFVRYLVDHSTREDNLYRHPWSEGDVVMWDNRCVMHKADHAGVVGDRVMHRGMVTDGV